MDKNEILNIIQKIYQDVLDNEDIVLTLDTTADDIEEWDSLAHVQLVVAIQKTFNIKFTSKETLLWDSVGDMVDSIISKL